jgi:hypothetical protein
MHVMQDRHVRCGADSWGKLGRELASGAVATVRMPVSRPQHLRPRQPGACWATRVGIAGEKPTGQWHRSALGQARSGLSVARVRRRARIVDAKREPSGGLGILPRSCDLARGWRGVSASLACVHVDINVHGARSGGGRSQILRALRRLNRGARKYGAGRQRRPSWEPQKGRL